MTIARNICLSLLASAAAATASAQESVAVDPFQAVTLQVPGQLIVRPATRQAVRIVGADPASLEIVSDPQRGLQIRCRTAACEASGARIEVFTNSFLALAVKGRGAIAVERGFAPVKTLALSVDGMGQIDSRAIDATTAVASVKGGGTIFTRAHSTLVASAPGGGRVIYSGSPPTVVQQGGDVRRAEVPASI